MLAAAVAFFLNMMLAGALLERAIRHSRPDRWMALRRDLTKADVREAVRAFVHRIRRAYDAGSIGEADARVLFPDRAEGSADEAIRALLGDARRAMSERRHEEFRRSLDSIRRTNRLRNGGIRWIRYSVGSARSSAKLAAFERAESQSLLIPRRRDS